MRALTGLAMCAVFALTACSGASSSPPIAKPPAIVCTAVLDARNGEWAQAEMNWITAESTPGESAQAVAAFLQLGNDAGTVALDQDAGRPTASDIQAYKSLFAGDGTLTAGC